MGLVAKPVYQQVAATSPGAARPFPTPQPRAIDEAALAAFGCDVSFISDEATSADDLVARAIEQTPAHALKRLLAEAFERLRGEYEVNCPIGHPAAVAARLRQAVSTTGIDLSPSDRRAVLDFLDNVNQRLFQHQTLAWLAGDAGLKIHLYGRGWEQHPTLARHARGLIGDERTRQAVYRASKINLSVGAYGAVTPRLLEGVAAGGFFLMRFCPADVIERFYPPLIAFCARQRIRSNADLAERATPDVRALLAFASRTLGVDVLSDWPEFVPHLMSMRATSRGRSAAVLWPSHYPSVCFSSRDELLNLVAKYLYDEPQRRQLAETLQRELIAAVQRVQVQVHRDALSPRPQDEVAA